MTEVASYVQPGFRTIIPYLYGNLELVDFVRDIFGAEVTRRGEPDSQGHFHCELKVGDSIVLIGNGYYADPTMAAATWIYVKDVDTTYKNAVRAGAKALREPANQSWGDRVAGVKDACGNTWWIATH